VTPPLHLALTLALAALALVAVLALATWAHLAFWRWRLALPGCATEILRARTADGWSLALARRRPGPGAPRRGLPVLLVHGLAMNRNVFDFGAAPHSMTAALAEAGLDCFALDLRGHGDSRPEAGAPRDWSLDDYLTLDVPAALDAVRAATGSTRVLWVGHSQGALLGLAAAALLPDRIAGVVALAPPIRLDASLPILRSLPRLARLRLARRGARLLAPFSGLWQPPSAGAAVQLGEMDRAAYRRMLMNIIEDLPVGVVAQFADFLERDRFGSRDGAVDYRALLPACRQPALFVAAPLDGFAPPRAVEEAWASWGGEKDLLVAPEGVGHTDLMLGRRAPTWTFPAVRDWLVAHAAAEAAAAPGGPAAPPFR
jgi:pimeloyl-ACP methyl ester carboxylesterase